MLLLEYYFYNRYHILKSSRNSRLEYLFAFYRVLYTATFRLLFRKPPSYWIIRDFNFFYRFLVTGVWTCRPRSWHWSTEIRIVPIQRWVDELNLSTSAIEFYSYTCNRFLDRKNLCCSIEQNSSVFFQGFIQHIFYRNQLPAGSFETSN